MSDIRVNTISDAAGTGPVDLHKQSAAKAWANTNSGGAPLSSFNVASVTDSSTGNYTINFTSSFTLNGNDLGVAVALCAGNNGEDVRCADSTSGTLEIRSYNSSNAQFDRHVSASVHGELA
mgnify:CR=1 FL=1